MANISSLIQDEKGFIWLAGQNGLTRFDGQQAITFSSSNTSWPLPFNWLHQVSQDGQYFLLATETDGLWRFNPETGQAKKVIANIPRQSHFNAVSFQGDYYINAPDILYRYRTKTGITEVIDNNIKIKNIIHTNKHLYVSSESGLYLLNNNTLTKILHEPVTTTTALSTSVVAITKNAIFRFNDDGSQDKVDHSNNIHAVTKAFHQDNFFTVTNKGIVNKFSGSTLQAIPHKFGNIKAARVRSFLHDNSGVLWLVSNRGVEKLTENSIKDHPITFDISINANELGVYNNDVIIGSYGAGLQNFLANTFTANINDNFSKKGLRVSDVITINNTLYIATFDGLWWLDANKNIVEKVAFPENNKLILNLEYHNNLLYIGTNYDGVYVYDLLAKKIINHISTSQGLSSPEVIDILPLDNGYTWLATASAVEITNNQTNSTRNIILPGSSKVVSLLKADNKIFAATLGDGIYALSVEGELLAQFGQGLRFSQLVQVNNEVWVTARPGLYKFNPKNYQLSMIENTERYSFVGSAVLLNNIVHASHYAGVLSLDLFTKEQFNPKVFISKTTVSGQSYLLNKTIEIDSGNDVVTLDLASLDYRPGANKQYRYTLDNNKWQQINGNQLTLTGLASGEYHIEIMATNSLGQWSQYKAFADIIVAFPWYWTPQIRLLYAISLFGIILLSAWLLYLRGQSIKHIHGILQKDLNNYGKTSMQVKRNLTSALALINENNIKKGTLLLQQCVNDLNKQQRSPEPNTLNGNSLSQAIPFFAQYIENKYQVKLSHKFEISEQELSDELQADLYRVIFEATTSAILNGSGRSFKIILQKFQNKIWLTISDDGQSFIHFNSKISFDISMYYIRQIANKHKGSINTFNEQGNASQLILSLPIMHQN